MSKFMENIKTANSVVRTGIFLAVTGCLAYGGYLGYDNYIKPGIDAKQTEAKLAELQSQLDQQQVELDNSIMERDRLNTSIQLLKIDERLANVEILEKSTNEKGEPTLLARFTEFNHFGDQVGPARDFELRGNIMYLDCWLVTFDDKYVEEADELRAASMCVFKSIYGDLDGPANSHPLDNNSEDGFPEVYYSDGKKSAFASRIWSDFWKVANSEDSQEDLGIRAAHGQANYIRVEPGKTYKFNVRASGGGSLEPVPE